MKVLCGSLLIRVEWRRVDSCGLLRLFSFWYAGNVVYRKGREDVEGDINPHDTKVSPPMGIIRPDLR